MKGCAWVCLFLAACGKKPAPEANVSLAHVPPAASSGAPHAALPAASAAAQPDARRALVERWNALLVAHDAAALGALYASPVQLYGQLLPRERAVALKSAAFARQPDYAQSIGPITLQPRDATHVLAVFDKSWTSAGKTERVVGTLLLAKEGEQWRIAAENDRKTEAWIAARAANDCWEYVASVVDSTKEAQRWLNGPTDPDAGHVSNGSRVILLDDTVTADVDVHESHEDHDVPLAWFEVNVETGSVQQTSALDWDSDHPESVAIGVEPKLLGKMLAACRAHVSAMHAHPATTSP